MTAPFRLYGAELSPYSVKVRSYLRFKGLDFEWLPRTQARQEEFARYAKLPLVPVLVDADETALQDSTPMIEKVEAEYPEPTIIPSDPALRFVAALIEDYADEWLNKAMFHYRWSYEDDQQAAARRIVDMLFDGADAPEGIEDAVKARMVGRLHYVGSSAETAPLIEGSFARLIEILGRLLQTNSYLFGGRPSLADFGLAAQLGQLLSDPTPGALLREKAPRVVAWIERMDSPRADGDFASFDALRESLADLLRDEVAGAYLAWAEANAEAVANDSPIVRAEIAGQAFTQKPQRYAAKALSELRRKRGMEEGNEALIALLEATGCDEYLAVSATEDDAEEDASEPAAEEASGDEGEES